MKKNVLNFLLTGWALLAFPVMGQPGFRLEKAPEIYYNAQVPAQTAEDESIMGYCKENSQLTGVRLAVAATLSAAIRIPAEKVELWKGSRLIRIKIGLSDASVTDMQLIIFKDINSDPVYTQSVEKPVKGWNEITLTTPYEIGSGDLFIGYTGKVPANKAVIGYDGKTFNFNSSWLKLEVPGYESAGWEDMYSSKFGSLGILGVVAGDHFPLYDLTLESISNPEFSVLGSSAQLSGTVSNWGKETITDFKISYSLGGQEIGVETIDGVNIPYRGSYTFTLPPVMMNIPGLHKNVVDIFAMNGDHEDQSSTDNQVSSSVSVYTADQTFTRKMLLENFTTEMCGQCPGGHKTLTNVLANRTDVIWVAHHAGYYTDDYTLQESEMLLPFYNSGSTYAPAVMVDRTLLSSTKSDAPVFGVSTALVTNALKEAAAIPAFVSVHIDGRYDPEARLLSVSVTGDATSPLPGDSLLLTIYLTEDGITTTNQAGSYGIYTHNHLLRAVLTNPFGDPVGLPSASYASKTYTCTLPDSWKPENVRIVAFVNNLNRYNVLDCRVMNAETLSVGAMLAVDETDRDRELKMVAEPGILRIEGAYDRLEIYSAEGSLLKTAAGTASVIEVPGWVSGVYLIRIISDGHTIIRKMIW